VRRATVRCGMRLSNEQQIEEKDNVRLSSEQWIEKKDNRRERERERERDVYVLP
jgi:hypothetical protein